MKTFAIKTADWAGTFQAYSGADAIRKFFRDVLSEKIKLTQLGQLGGWSEGGEFIPFRIGPALVAAGKLTVEDVRDGLKRADATLDFTLEDIGRMVVADAWMIDPPLVA